MVSVDATVLEEEYAPGKSLLLHSYWEPGIAEISIEKVTEANGDIVESETLFHQEVKEWRFGDFTDDDVRRRFGGRFNQLVVRETQKLGKKAYQFKGRRGPVDVRGHYREGGWVESYTRKAPRRVR